MLFIQSALDRDELAELNTRLKALPAPQAKKTRPGDPPHNDSKTRALMGWVKTIVSHHPLVLAYGQPARFSSFYLSRLQPGDPCGLYPVDPLMKCEDGQPMRSDLAFTLFLSPKGAYDGGALTLEANDGTRDIRLDPGGMVMHRAGQLHQVTPVTRGERLAVIGWIQSLFQREDERDILFDLQRMLLSSKDKTQTLMLQKTIGNLHRMWAKI